MMFPAGLDSYSRVVITTINKNTGGTSHPVPEK